MVRFLFFCCLASFAQLGCSSEVEREQAPAPVFGAKIYDFEGDADSLFNQWNGIGLNTAFVGKELFAKADFRQAARDAGIRTYVVLPTFFDPEALDADPSLAAITEKGTPAVDDWVRFVCPSRDDFRQQKVEEIRNVVREWNPDGISIDFIRHFVFWETVFPDTPADSLPNTCFDDHCMMRFRAETGIAMPREIIGPVAAARWIRENHLETWIPWKSSLITTMVHDIVTAAKEENPNVMVNLHIVPWTATAYDGGIKRIAGQDIASMSEYADYVSPMTYHHMVRQTPKWVHDIVVSMAPESAVPVLPSIQVGRAYLENGLSAEVFGEALASALEPPSAGVVFWSWERLSSSPEKLDVLKTTLNRSGELAP